MKLFEYETRHPKSSIIAQAAIVLAMTIGGLGIINANFIGSRIIMAICILIGFIFCLIFVICTLINYHGLFTGRYKGIRKLPFRLQKW